jgi:sulfate/thiosulfate transport system ATP-binding protein
MSIEARDVSKSFGEFRALDRVDLDVPRGSLVALLGPSGSGKTTLLRILAGLERADPGAGTIRFHGQDVTTKHVRHRGVGFVFQHYALFRHLTVFENIAFGLRVRPRRERPGRRELRRRVDELLALVQLEGLGARLPGQLSGGQRQRVAFARALATDPSVLLLDEPFGALDAKVRQELRAWLHRLHAELDVTSVFVTHDQDEALDLADQVAVMHKGRIEQVGTPDEVFHSPRTEFVMSFLGAVNRFAARVEGNRVRFAGIALPAPADVRPGDDAHVFVRPYEIDLVSTPNGHPALPVEVRRVHAAGPIVRVELETTDGASLHAEIPQDRFEAERVSLGKRMHASLRAVRVFPARS